MVTTQVFISLCKAPRNREAGDHAAQEVLGFMGAQNAGACTVTVVLTGGTVETKKSLMPVLPMPQIVLAQLLVRLEQRGARLLAGFVPHFTKRQRQYELSVARLKVDFPSQSDVAI